MKRIFVVVLLAALTLPCFAQEERKKEDYKEHGFKKENLFTGGDVTASFYSGGTVLGLSPYFGYSINKYLDVAASLNFNYISQRDYQVYGDKIRQNDFGPGAFIRVYPIHFLFAQVQYEHNFIRQKYIPAANSGYQEEIVHFDANSLLVGGGYTSGRRDGNNTFYYVSILWDVAKVAESPYVDGLGRAVPVIKAGVNIGLFQGGGRRHRRR